ncbi:MAG: hypothetical protein ACO25B_02105 [Chitinophagaceae bacterium]
MKKLLVAVVLLGGVTAVGFASFNNKKKNCPAAEKNCEKAKKDCSRKCIFSL